MHGLNTIEALNKRATGKYDTLKTLAHHVLESEETAPNGYQIFNYEYVKELLTHILGEQNV